jgi:hypothetical protein|tara:strand:+ start:65 stop:1234 length:1170 start_codon:yes stop_codon:yes gene_type:complete
MRVLDAIIKAMGNLNGEAPLNKIYLEVNKYRETPSHSIRGRIYEHASECDAYKKTNLDLFESSNGKGQGKWKLRVKPKSNNASWLDEIIHMDKFIIGERYKKKDIRKISKLSASNGPREPWTGRVFFANAVLLFVNLDKTDVQDSLKFNDFFEGLDFYWESQNANTINTEYIKQILEGIPVYLFCRINKKEDFLYIGGLNAVDFDDSVSPMQFQFELLNYDDNPSEGLKKIYEWQNSSTVKIPNFSTDNLKKNRKTAQGFIGDSKKKNAIESHAMKEADQYYSSRGYEVHDCSNFRGLGYDLKCVKDNKVVEVEVKGTQSTGAKVFLTKNEVLNAKTTNNQADLFIVHSMNLNTKDDEYIILNSEIKIIDNWLPKDEDLEALEFQYTIS